MAFPINEYPYTDLHEMNMDYVLRQIGSERSEIENLSGEVVSLNTRVENVENRVENLDPSLANRKFIVIADSYGHYYNTEGRNYYSQAFHELGVTDFYDFNLGGAGFDEPGVYNFLAVLQANEAVITEKEGITDIIVCGGANDQGNLSDVYDGIEAFCTYVKVTYPNARIHIGHFSNAMMASNIALVGDSYRAYKRCVDFKALYIENSQYIMAAIGDFNSDMVHPNTRGMSKLTKYFKTYIVKGSFDVDEVVKNTFASGTNGTLTDDPIEQRQHNGVVTLVPGGAGQALRFTLDGSAIAAGLQGRNDILRCVDGFLLSNTGNNIAIQCTLDGGSSYFCNAYLYVRTINASNEIVVGMITYATSTIFLGATTMFMGNVSMILF